MLVWCICDLSIWRVLTEVVHHNGKCYDFRILCVTGLCKVTLLSQLQTYETNDAELNYIIVPFLYDFQYVRIKLWPIVEIVEVAPQFITRQCYKLFASVGSSIIFYVYIVFYCFYCVFFLFWQKQSPFRCCLFKKNVCRYIVRLVTNNLSSNIVCVITSCHVLKGNVEQKDV